MPFEVYQTTSGQAFAGAKRATAYSGQRGLTRKVIQPGAVGMTWHKTKMKKGQKTKMMKGHKTKMKNGQKTKMMKGHKTKMKEGVQDQNEDGAQHQNEEESQDQNEEGAQDQNEEDQNKEEQNEEDPCGCTHPSIQSPSQLVVNLPILCCVLLQLCCHQRHRLQVVTPVVQSFSFTDSHLMQQSLALCAEGTPSGEVQAPQEQQVLHLGL